MLAKVHIHFNISGVIKLVYYKIEFYDGWSLSITIYQWLKAPDPQTQLVAHASQSQSHWRKCWRSHPHDQWSYHSAYCHQAGCHAPGNTTPSMHCQSVLRPGPHGWRCTHAAQRKRNCFKWLPTNSCLQAREPGDLSTRKKDCFFFFFARQLFNYK